MNDTSVSRLFEVYVYHYKTVRLFAASEMAESHHQKGALEQPKGVLAAERWLTPDLRAVQSLRRSRLQSLKAGNQQTMQNRKGSSRFPLVYPPDLQIRRIRDIRLQIESIVSVLTRLSWVFGWNHS